MPLTNVVDRSAIKANDRSAINDGALRCEVRLP